MMRWLALLLLLASCAAQAHKPSDSYLHFKMDGARVIGQWDIALRDLEQAIRPATRLVFLETPTNPMMRLCDLAAMRDIARSAGALLMVDNTFASPALCRPLEHGADIVCESATKYLNGHHDVTAGVFAGGADAVGRARTWQIEFMADPDGEVAEGDILIQSDLVLAEREEPGAGQRTRRVATMHVGGRTTAVREPAAATSKPVKVPVARLSYEDDSGPRTFEMVSEGITIGRGGASRRVDVRIDSSADVSREHLSIRRDPSGRFFVSDLSMLGTTVNGKRLPKGYDEHDGDRTSNGIESPLPDGSRIGLADTVYIDFEILGS